jgi:hypothetical protein
VVLLDLVLSSLHIPHRQQCTVAAMGDDPMPDMSVRDLEEMEKQAAAGLDAIRDKLVMAALIEDAKYVFAAVAAGGSASRSPQVAAVAEADEPVSGSPQFAAVAEADEPVSGPPRLRLPVAKVYGAGPLETGRPGIGARARRHVPKGASKWHKLRPVRN